MKDANQIAAEHTRREERSWRDSLQPPYPTPGPAPVRRFGRLIGAVTSDNEDNPAVDQDGQTVWERVSVLPFADGLLLAEDEEGLRTIINPRAYLFLKFRPDEGE